MKNNSWLYLIAYILYGVGGRLDIPVLSYLCVLPLLFALVVNVLYVKKCRHVVVKEWVKWVIFTVILLFILYIDLYK